MKLLHKLRNKYFATILSLLMLVLASFGILKLDTPSVAEAVSFSSESSLTISNGSFTSYSSSSEYPYTPSDFTTRGRYNPTTTKTGAIKVDDTNYSKNYSKYGFTAEYGLANIDNPGQAGSDGSILMINTTTSSNLAYVSKEFTLSANSTYYISVSVKTIGSNSSASVYLLKDGAVYSNCKIENIQTAGWTDYTFFVTTNSYEDVTLQFAMQIGNLTSGTSGCVLFDELHAGKISKDTMEAYTSRADSNHYYCTDSEVDNSYKKYDFDNNLVVYTNDGNGNFTPTDYNENYFATIKQGGEDKQYEIRNGVLTLTTNKGYINFEGGEETFEPNNTYRFSIKAKVSTAISSGNAYVKLTEILDDEDDYEDFKESSTTSLTAKESKLSISSATSNSVEDGFVEYVIFIHTGEDLNSKVKFSFGLGTSDTSATGEISFKEFKIERVPYSAFSSASTGDTTGKMDIADRISIDTDKFFSNGTFDKMQSNSIDGVPYPATPTDWTIAGEDSSNQLSGVVNLSKLSLVNNKYSDMLNGVLYASGSCTSTMNNNVLMIYNGSKSTQSYTSASTTLSANKYYRIRTQVYTNLDLNSGATIVLKSGEAVIGKVTNINTNAEWKQVEFYVHTAGTSTEVTLELALGYGENKVSGYVFFDHIEIASADSAYTYENKYATDIDLNNPMLKSDESSNGYYRPTLFKGENLGSNNVNAGLIDLTDDLKLESITSDPEMREALKKGDRTTALIINSTLGYDVYYKYTSLVAYNFESGSYYKLSFALFTNNLAQEEKEENTDNGKLAQGANISLTGLENASFTYEQSNGKWTVYEFYIGVNETATSNLEYSLGSEFTGCSGIALLADIKLETIEEVDFNEATGSATCLKIDTIETTETDEDEEEESESENNFSWAYIPTIATFLAIVIAVVGIFIKRNVKFKKRVKGGKVAYDRDETVLRNKFRRIAIDQRDAEVRELTKECEELTVLRAEYEAKYKEALNRLRSAKLANRDGSKKHEVYAIEREVKHISKEVARYGVQVNNYENEIEFMKTEAYLTDIERQLSKEDVHTRNRDRKESLLSDEEREFRIAQREQKLVRDKEKAERKAERLANKKAKIEQEKLEIEKTLKEAVEKDEQDAKQRELKKLKEAELKLAKEQAKAKKQMEQLAEQQAEIEQEKEQAEQEQSNATETESVEERPVEEIIEQPQAENDTDEPVMAEKVEEAEPVATESAGTSNNSENIEQDTQTSENSSVKEKSSSDKPAESEETTTQSTENKTE